MKTLSSFVLLFVFAFQLQAGNITFSAKNPALVNVHSDIKSVAIINRTVPSDRKKSQLEGILTGEGIDGDRKIIQSAMSGLADRLKRSNRFKVIHTTEALVGSKFAGKFPNALDWATVKKLCAKYKVDAIIVLESFDSDFIITNARKTGEVLSFVASGLAQIDMGFRFYDPFQKSIVDQHHFSYSNKFNSTSGSIQDAIAGLMNRTNAMCEVSYAGAADYAGRLIPTWYKITRTYFQKCKGDKNLAKGARMMESNDWDAALKFLKQAVATGHEKTRGRAAHNIAVVYEILGDLDLSKKWATTAWGEYENRVSKDYAYRIGKRIRQRRILDQQYGSLGK